MEIDENVVAGNYFGSPIKIILFIPNLRGILLEGSVHYAASSTINNSKES